MGLAVDLMRLGRVHTAMATAAVPGIACHLAGGSPLAVFLVSGGAFFHHAWGFSLNEIMDLKVDRMSKELSDKPLVSGKVGKGKAIGFSIACLCVSIGMFSLAAHSMKNYLVPVLGLLTMATIAGGLYDILGKRLTLSDLFVALWMLSLVLSSSAVGGRMGIAVVTVAIISSLHLLFNNSVEGGLKDVENDRSCKVPTLAVVTGCSCRRGRLKVTTPFLIWAVLLRAAFVAMASVFAFLISDEAGWGDWLTIMVSLVGFVLFTDALNFLRGGKKDRKSLLRSFSIHEMGSFAMSLLVVLPAAGLWGVLAAFFVPAGWFVFANRVIFKSSMSPKV